MSAIDASLVHCFFSEAHDHSGHATRTPGYARISISGDELKVMSFSKSSTGSGNVHLVWKRAK
ncbi:MAG: hypothetical protein WAM44_18170 [Chthoniobacterales bacterium]